jgi:hypothetical protein
MFFKNAERTVGIAFEFLILAKITNSKEVAKIPVSISVKD